MPSSYQTINDLLKADRLTEALAAADAAIAALPSPQAELLYLRGKILWRLGRRSEAMGAYGASAELEPDGPASRALELARDIDSFFNPDIFNP